MGLSVRSARKDVVRTVDSECGINRKVNKNKKKKGCHKAFLT